MTSRDGRRHERAEVHALRAVPSARPDALASDVLQSFGGHHLDAADMIVLLGESDRLVGVVRPERLLTAPSGARMAELAEPHPPVAAPDTDQEAVALMAIRHALPAVPVAREDGTFVGLVPSRSLLDILRREHVEDLHRLAGIRRDAKTARRALDAAPARRVRRRLPWLLVGAVGSFASALLVARFERVLAAQVAIAFFMPAIVYLADAIGTQTETIVVRGLSSGRTAFRALLRREVEAGLLIGLTLGVLLFPAVLVAFDSVRLAGAVAIATFLAGGIATTIGLLLPWLLWRGGGDPAFGSGPLGTIIQDILSLLVYFAAVALLMG
jgi:magnesium transporter